MAGRVGWPDGSDAAESDGRTALMRTGLTAGRVWLSARLGQRVSTHRQVWQSGGSDYQSGPAGEFRRV